MKTHYITAGKSDYSERTEVTVLESALIKDVKASTCPYNIYFKSVRGIYGYDINFKHGKHDTKKINVLT